MFCNGENRITPNDIKLSDNFLICKYSALSKYDIDECCRLFSDLNSKELFLRIVEKYKTGFLDFSELESNQLIYSNNYFSPDLMEKEVYVDCSVCNGRTILDFIFYAQGKYDKIYAFEPDIINYSAIKYNFDDIPNIQLLNSAVSNIIGKVSFDNRGTQSSHIIDDDANVDGQ